MATKLIKTVKRETFSTDRKGKPIIVSLEAGDMISFRTKGKRSEFRIYLGHCLAMAQLLTWNEQYQQKLKIYNEKKKAGYRNLKKPKRSQAPFNEMYYKILNRAIK